VPLEVIEMVLDMNELLVEVAQTERGSTEFQLSSTDSDIGSVPASNQETSHTPQLPWKPLPDPNTENQETKKAESRCCLLL
jgi:hypothetical protein